MPNGPGTYDVLGVLELGEVSLPRANHLEIENRPGSSVKPKNVNSV